MKWAALSLLVACSLSSKNFLFCAEPLPPVRLRADYAILAQCNADPTPAGAQEHLQFYLPWEIAVDDEATIVARLGDDDFHMREYTTMQLARLPRLSPTLLSVASRSSDPEVRWRTQTIIQQRAKRDPRGMHAALRILAEHPQPDTIDTLLRLAASYNEESQQRILGEKLAQVCAKQNAFARISHQDASLPPGQQLTMAVAVEAENGALSRDWLAELAWHENAEIALQAAKRLGNSGDRRSLAPLVHLIATAEPKWANPAYNFLRNLTAFEEEAALPKEIEPRTVLVGSLQSWLEQSEHNLELRYPVLESLIERGDLAGKSLVATGSSGSVMELDAEGKIGWEYPIDAWSAEKLTSGNILIASYQSNQILEIDPAGRVVWNMNNVNAMRAKPLPNGHVLVAVFSGNRVLELNSQHEVAWSHETPDNCFDVERLSNGHTVYACPNKVREIAADGTLVRELALEGRINSIQVLSNGDWLVANYGKNEAQQYDRAGRLAWSHAERQPNDAYRLANGHTLITTAQHCVEVNDRGDVVREIAETRYGCARR